MPESMIPESMKPTAAPGWEVIEFDEPIADWTLARFLVRAPGAPGGIAALIGGLGEEQERANAKLIATAGELEFEERLRAEYLCHYWNGEDLARTLVERERQLADALRQLQKGGLNV